VLHRAKLQRDHFAKLLNLQITLSQLIGMSRPICPYPRATRYKGRGDTNDAASFECAAPPDQQQTVMRMR
jgi:hypothetical protein